MTKSFLLHLHLTLGLLIASTSSARTWTDAATGRVIDAELVHTDGSNAMVKMKDGRVFVLALSRLSKEDQAHVATLAPGKPVVPPASGPSASAARDRYEDVPKFAKEVIPVQGKAHRKLAALDEVVLDLMVERGIPAVSLSVMKSGKIVHERAFGWGDADLKMPHQPNTAMRLASMTKPITRALIFELVDRNKLKFDDKVFKLLDLDKSAPANLDKRWRDITVQHLLDHKGGWDRESSPDQDFTIEFDKMSAALGVKLVDMKPAHMFQWGLDKVLQFDPGSRDAYSNYGYAVLGRVVEKVTGETYVDLVQQHVAKKSGMTSLRQSNPDAVKRAPDEIWYCYHPVFPPGTSIMPYRFDTKEAASALACTASDYCRFIERYRFDGVRRSGERAAAGHGGRMPGTSSFGSERADGICFAILANRMEEKPGEWLPGIVEKLNKLIDEAAGAL